ncbi:MAG: BMP family ABC transporter substrate-binding protein [Anaerolineae bacterium]|nr:BMP family ABC transporter substrate-binding protein [Anaerolineae bacterium]
MHRTIRIRSLLLLAGILLTAACTTEPAATPAPTPNPNFRVGLVTDVGTIRDGTFNEQAHRGASQAAEAYGLDYIYRESVDSEHYDLLIGEMLEQDRNVVVTVGYLMTGQTLTAAVANPDVYFIGVDQFYEDPPPNLVGLQFREDEGGFLAGALAGMMTASNTVAVIGGEEIPPVVRFVNGFINGVHYSNADAAVLYVYAESFIDPEFGRETASRFMAQHADVIFGAGGLTGSFGIFAAAAEGAWVIGVDQDEYRTTFDEGALEGSDRLLTSAIKRVDTAVYQAIVSVLQGDFTGGVVTLSAAECGVGLAPFHEAADAIPAEVQARLEAIWRALAGGTLTTGASGAADDSAPEPLGRGEPSVAADAPTLADCEL